MTSVAGEAAARRPLAVPVRPGRGGSFPLPHNNAVAQRAVDPQFCAIFTGLTRLTQAAAQVDTPQPDPTLWLSVAEIARRQTPPVSREAVSKRVKAFEASGQLSTRKGPGNTKLVNVVAYDRLVKWETDPAQALRNVPPAPPPAQGESGDGFAQHRAARESYQAENARLDLEERLKRLVDKEEVERRTMDIFRRMRDRLMAMPARLSDRLAAQPDAAAIRTTLAAEIRKELENFAKRLDAASDEGAETEIADDDDAREPDRSEPQEAPG